VRRFAASLAVLWGAALATSAAAPEAELAAGDGAWRFAQGATSLAREVPINASWADASALTFRARLSQDTLHTVHLLVYLVGGDGWWYQAARTVELERAQAVAVSLDLRPESGDWVPRGHLRPWDGYVTRSVRLLGIKAFSDGGFEGSVIIEGVALQRGAAPPPETLRLLDFEAPSTARVGERCEFRFRLPRVFDNPFDPAEVSVEGQFVPTSGEVDARVIPGFFYQRYVRAWEGEADRLVPAGPAEWRIRFWPERAGPHQCRIVVRTRDAEARVPWAFVVTGRAGEVPARPPEGFRPSGGYSEDSPAYPPEGVKPSGGKASGGEGVAPAGGEFRLRVPDLGISREHNGRDAIFVYRKGGWSAEPKTPPAGTLRAWRAPLEWTDRWGGYGGLGRFNLAIASQFDDLLDDAASRGLALPLALTCDEPFGDRAKFNWRDNPLNKANGGPLDAPSRFFTNLAAWGHFQAVARYAVARWGGHPAVASWELWCTVPANGAEPWHAKAGEFLASQRFAPKELRSHHPQTVPPAAFTILNTFRQEEMASRDRWMLDTVVKHNAEALRTVSAPASHGDEALSVLAKYPGEAAILRTIEKDWHRYDRLAFDVFLPDGAPNDMRVMVYLRDGDLWWYEALLPAYLRPGDWTKLLVDLSGETTRWEPRGHDKVFDRYALQRVRVMGLRVFGHRPYQGRLYIDNIQLWRDPSAPEARQVRVLEAKPNLTAVPRFAKYELTFRLSETYGNPFDPEVVKVLGHFVSPSGEKIDMPAFFYQDYERHLADGREVLTPKGQSCWKLRFAPAEVGRWTYSLSVNKERPAGLGDQTFECVASKLPGFVRRSKADPRYFELSSGEFFYPIGKNLRSPSDSRQPYAYDFALPEAKGTFVYDEYYKKLAENGMNWARVWQCPWWCGLEWTKQWPGFQGLGRYNLENAWRFDYLLEQAERLGIYLDVCLTNHGQITIEPEIDRQWDTNPLNAELGENGPLQRAAEFYTDTITRRLFRKRLYYTIARWGYSTHLMALSLFSEMEFTEAYWRDAGAKNDNEGTVRCPVVADWVGETAGWLKRTDPFRHLVSTHFSHPWRGADVWERPELDIVQSNAYSAFGPLGGDWSPRSGGDVPRAIDRYLGTYMGQFGRPVLIAEYGGHWMQNPSDKLDAELHAGIWASVTSHLAGSTGFWWWLHVHYAGRYAHYRAAARYMAGEDRRGQDLRQTELSLWATGTALTARILKNGQRAYVWVYHPRIVRSLDATSAIEGARLDLPDMAPGRYAIEFWNTYTGEIAARQELTCAGTTLTIRLPAFRNDIALKIKPAAEPAASTPAPRGR